MREICGGDGAVRGKRIVGAHDHAPYLASIHADVVVSIRVHRFQQQADVEKAAIHAIPHLIRRRGEELEGNQREALMKRA